MKCIFGCCRLPGTDLHQILVLGSRNNEFVWLFRLVHLSNDRHLLTATVPSHRELKFNNCQISTTTDLSFLVITFDICLYYLTWRHMFNRTNLVFFQELGNSLFHYYSDHNYRLCTLNYQNIHRRYCNHPARLRKAR